ncbi:MAG: RNA polymerase sigma factor, partial [Armatimonadota bacterium]|nr:RNA polymerase sigma factor [Armatimonadota bacterium]
MADQDTELMLRAAQGDEDAFAVLFSRYYARAVNVAYRFLGSQDAAEDIAMDAFVRIYETKNAFRGSSKFSTYLYRVVVNRCLNAAKRKSIVREETFSEEHQRMAGFTDPGAILQKEEASTVVKQAILDLPTNQRLAIVLTSYEGLSYQSAAEAMG